MEKLRKNILLKTFLIFLFLGFYIGNTAFVHTHYYFGYSVTHSHPYTKNAAGQPNHTHNSAELALIAQLNSFVLDLIPTISIGIVSAILLFIFIQQYRSGIIKRVVEGYNLRAPPVVVA